MARMRRRGRDSHRSQDGIAELGSEDSEADTALLKCALLQITLQGVAQDAQS
jgi:hypothetical protein